MTQHCTTPRATEKDGSTACKICKSYKVIRCFQIFQATNESQTAAGFIGVFRIASAILSKSSLMRCQISQSPQFWASLSFRDANGCSMHEHARLWHLMAFDGIWWHLASSKGSNINLPPWPPLANHVGPVSLQHSPSSIWNPVGQSGSKIGIWSNHYNHMKSAHQMQSFQNWHVLFLGPRWLLRRKVSPEATWLEARRKVPMYGKSWHKLKLASTITNLCFTLLSSSEADAATSPQNVRSSKYCTTNFNKR